MARPTSYHFCRGLGRGIPQNRHGSLSEPSHHWPVFQAAEIHKSSLLTLIGHSAIQQVNYFVSHKENVMGGKHEDKIEAPVEIGGSLEPAGAAPTGDAIPKVDDLSQSLRYHVKDGYVHFHIDQPDKLRVAIPVAEWWSGLEQLKHLRIETWRYIDHDAGTMLEIQAGLNDKAEFDLVPKVTKIASGSGSIFKKLDEFSRKARGK
jgi:hypothetical protein